MQNVCFKYIMYKYTLCMNIHERIFMHIDKSVRIIYVMYKKNKCGFY